MVQWVYCLQGTTTVTNKHLYPFMYNSVPFLQRVWATGKDRILLPLCLIKYITAILMV